MQTDPTTQFADYVRSLSLIVSEGPPVIRITDELRDVLATALKPHSQSAGRAFSKAEAERLADAFGTDSPRWSWLEASSFGAISLIFLFAEKCPARDAGLYRLYISLRDLKAGDERTAYKKAAGEEAVSRFALNYFLIDQMSLSTRRWAGLLLYELLEAIENRIIVHKLSEEHDTLLEMFGNSLIRGQQNTIRHISAMLICRIGSDFDNMQQLEYLGKVFSGVSALESGDKFPCTSTQWSDEMFRYLEKIDVGRRKMHWRLPRAPHALAVAFGTSYVPKSGTIICDLEIDNIFSIQWPGNDGLPRWIDIDLENIEEVTILSSGIHTAAGAGLADLQLRFRDYAERGYLYQLDTITKNDPDRMVIRLFGEESEALLRELLGARNHKRRKENKQLGGNSVSVAWDSPNAQPAKLWVGAELEAPGMRHSPTHDVDLQLRRSQMEADVATAGDATTTTPALSKGNTEPVDNPPMLATGKSARFASPPIVGRSSPSSRADNMGDGLPGSPYVTTTVNLFNGQEQRNAVVSSIPTSLPPPLLTMPPSAQGMEQPLRMSSRFLDLPKETQLDTQQKGSTEERLNAGMGSNVEIKPQTPAPNGPSTRTTKSIDSTKSSIQAEMGVYDLHLIKDESEDKEPRRSVMPKVATRGGKTPAKKVLTKKAEAKANMNPKSPEAVSIVKSSEMKKAIPAVKAPPKRSNETKYKYASPLEKSVNFSESVATIVSRAAVAVGKGEPSNAVPNAEMNVLGNFFPSLSPKTEKNNAELLPPSIEKAQPQTAEKTTASRRRAVAEKRVPKPSPKHQTITPKPSTRKKAPARGKEAPVAAAQRIPAKRSEKTLGEKGLVTQARTPASGSEVGVEIENPPDKLQRKGITSKEAPAVYTSPADTTPSKKKLKTIDSTPKPPLSSAPNWPPILTPVLEETDDEVLVPAQDMEPKRRKKGVEADDDASKFPKPTASIKIDGRSVPLQEDREIKAVSGERQPTPPKSMLVHAAATKATPHKEPVEESVAEIYKTHKELTETKDERRDPDGSSVDMEEPRIDGSVLTDATGSGWRRLLIVAGSDDEDIVIHNHSTAAQSASRRTKTVEGTGSPLPKAIPSRREMEKAKREPSAFSALSLPEISESKRVTRVSDKGIGGVETTRQKLGSKQSSSPIVLARTITTARGKRLFGSADYTALGGGLSAGRKNNHGGEMVSEGEEHALSRNRTGSLGGFGLGGGSGRAKGGAGWGAELTVGVLTKLNKFWIQYLKTGEEKATGSVQKYAETVEKLVSRLERAHLDEYGEFRTDMELFRGRVAAACEATRHALTVSVGETGNRPLELMKQELGERYNERVDTVRGLRARMMRV